MMVLLGFIQAFNSTALVEAVQIHESFAPRDVVISDKKEITNTRLNNKLESFEKIRASLTAVKKQIRLLQNKNNVGDILNRLQTKKAVLEGLLNLVSNQMIGQLGIEVKNANYSACDTKGLADADDKSKDDKSSDKSSTDADDKSKDDKSSDKSSTDADKSKDDKSSDKSSTDADKSKDDKSSDKSGADADKSKDDKKVDDSDAPKNDDGLTDDSDSSKNDDQGDDNPEEDTEPKTPTQMDPEVAKAANDTDSEEE